MPSCCTSLPNSLPRFLPSLLSPHSHTDAGQYRDSHLLWPNFNIQVMSLSGNCSLLCTHGRDSCTQRPCLLVFPSQLRKSCWLEGNSSSVGDGTQFQGARAAQAFAFASITQHHSSDKEVTVFEQQEMGKTCWMGRLGPCSSTAQKQPQHCLRQHVLGPDLAKQSGTRLTVI